MQAQNRLSKFLLLIESGVFLACNLLNVSSDGGCFFYCICAFFLDRLSEGHHCDEVLLDAVALRNRICDGLLEFQDIKIPGFGLSPGEFFNTTYSPSATCREVLHNPVFNQRVFEAGLDPSQTIFFVQSFEQYVEMMRHPNTHVDNMIVAFFSYYFHVGLNVLTCSQTEVHQEPTGNSDVDNLMSMGFRLDVVMQVLERTNGNVEQSIGILLENPSAQFIPDESQKKIWREQPYNHESSYRINLLNDAGHFQLILTLLQQDTAEEPKPKPRIKLPDILCDDDEPQPIISEERITSPEQFYDACSLAISNEYPEHLTVDIRFNAVYYEMFSDNLFSSIQFVEHDCLKYRIISFTMENGAVVSYHGAIENLSRGSEKKIFYSQLYPEISHQDVVSVVIAKIH